MFYLLIQLIHPFQCPVTPGGPGPAWEASLSSCPTSNFIFVIKIMGAGLEAWLFWLTELLEFYFRFLGFWHLLVFVPHVSERSVCGGAFLHLDFITKLHSPFLCTHCSCMGRRITFLIPAASSSDNFCFCFLISAEVGQWKLHLLAVSPWTCCRKMVQNVISTWHSTARPPSLSHIHTQRWFRCWFQRD